MRIPVDISTVDIQIDADGRVYVAVDKQPYADDRTLGREDLQSAVDEIPTNLETAVPPDDLASLRDAVSLDSVPGARRISRRLEEGGWTGWTNLRMRPQGMKR